MGFFNNIVDAFLGPPDWPESSRKQSDTFQVQAVRDYDSNDGNFNIQIKGALSVSYASNLECAINFFDKSSDSPILSLYEQTTEDDTRVFLHSVDLGMIKENQYFPDWVDLTSFVKEIMLPPRSGSKVIEVRAYLFSSDNPISFEGGYIDSKAKCISYATSTFTTKFEDKGYRDQSEHRDLARVATIPIAMAMAMADGSLDKSEGLVIKKWIANTLDTYISEDKQNEMKKQLNEALDSSYKAFLRLPKNSKLSENIDSTIDAFNVVASNTDKFIALELCLDVLAADGFADEAELNLVKDLSTKLDLDYDEVQKMKDKTMISIDTKLSSSDSTSDEALIVLNMNLNKEDSLAFVKKEFIKWNGRLNSLQAGNERDNAQRMLDALARLKKKHET